MRYFILILAIVAALALSPAGADSHDTWQPPEECADEDRKVPGNRSTPCRYVLPELTEIEYRIRFDYPNCIEELVFHLPGIKPLPEQWSRSLDVYLTTPGNIRFDRMSELYDMFVRDGRLTMHNDYIAYRGYTWNLSSVVAGPSWFYVHPDSLTQKPLARITLQISFGEITGLSNPAQYPDAGNTVELANSCLSLVQQEKADREHAARLAREAEAEQARIQAELAAVAREEEQALREAEAQAEQARLELEAAKSRQITIAKIEATRTETLIAEIAHKELIAGILQEIARIRLAGQDDRARLTNEFLTRMESSGAEFDAETAEVEARIQEYLDFNEKLIAQIEAYYENVQTRLLETQAKLEAQYAQIEAIEQEVLENPSTPVPTQTGDGTVDIQSDG